MTVDGFFVEIWSGIFQQEAGAIRQKTSLKKHEFIKVDWDEGQPRSCIGQLSFTS